MTRISSKSTFYYKRLFPIIWFGFIAFFIANSFRSGVAWSEPTFLIGPCVMAVFGFFLLKKMVWNLADEVQDGGDYLLIRYRGYEDRLPLSNVMNVNASTNMNPPRITLRLVKPGKFGPEVVFSPRMEFTLNPFAKNKVAEDLIVRVDRARSNRAA